MKRLCKNEKMYMIHIVFENFLFQHIIFNLKIRFFLAMDFLSSAISILESSMALLFNTNPVSNRIVGISFLFYLILCQCLHSQLSKLSPLAMGSLSSYFPITSVKSFVEFENVSIFLVRSKIQIMLVTDCYILGVF